MWRVFLIFSSALFIANVVLAREMHFVTYEAPPFVSESLPEQGAAIYALRQMLKKTDCELKITFAPFLRGRKLALKDESVIGFFPVTQVNVTQDFTMSKVVYQTPWVFAERKDNPILWKKPEDILPYRIGNASGYEMAVSFQRLHQEKKLKLEPASTDELNLLKLANKRVDLVFIDAGIFAYLLKTSEKLKPYQNQLQLNSKVIHMDQYGVAFKKTPRAIKEMENFNKLASEEEFTRHVEAYFKKYPGP